MVQQQQRALVVSIHDVSPLTFVPVQAMIEELRSAGVNRFSLLVIPHHHHRQHFLNDAQFVTWLKEQAQNGSEVVIHGYYHQRERRARETLVEKFLMRVYTADEGEFFDIDAATALERVQRAQQEFASVGLAPSGFIAPAWLLSAAAADVLRTLGFVYTTRLRTVEDLQLPRIVASQSLVYTVRSALGRTLSLGWNAALSSWLSSAALLRLSVHPVDLRYRLVWRQIKRLAAQALEERQPTTYEQWVRAQRGAQPAA